MGHFRTSRSWLALAALTGAGVSVAAAAHADTVVYPPTIATPSPFFYAGVAAQFTFTEGSGGTDAVAFEYTVNGGPTSTVAAVGDTAQVAVTPTARVSYIEVSAVAADGTVSTAATYTAFAESTSPAADKDMSGDGVPDLVTVGGTAGLGSGIWQAPGTGANGRVLTPARNITGNALSGEPDSYLDGQQVAVGHYSFERFQDVFVYNPVTGGGLVLPGSADGSPLDYNGVTVVSSRQLEDPITHDSPLRITGGLDASNVDNGHDGLFAITGDATNGYALDYDEPLYVGFDPLRLSAALTPDGTADWNEWTLATAQTPGGIDMFLWNESTGRLYLWTGVSVAAGTTTALTYTAQYRLAKNWNKGVGLATLEAADFGGAATAGLWTVSPAGVATSYTVGDLCAARHSGKVRATHVQPLS
jgi:hypothetical protein